MKQVDDTAKLLERRKQMRAALSEYLRITQQLIEFADDLRANKRRKEADRALKLVEIMIDNYKQIDQPARDIAKEIE